jgi:hypothetical protein
MAHFTQMRFTKDEFFADKVGYCNGEAISEDFCKNRLGDYLHRNA